MGKEYTYYPEIKIEPFIKNKEEYIKLSTTIRKKVGGKWYDVEIYKEYKIQNHIHDMNNIYKFFNDFHKKVYIDIHLFDISNVISNDIKNNFIKKSKFQISEEDRLINTYIKNYKNKDYEYDN